MPEAISAYINAYARGLKSRLLTKADIDSMFENGQVDEIANTLLKSQYEVEMAEALSRYSGAEAIDDAVSRNLVNTFTRLKAMCREESARLADVFISRWDLIAVKALLRNRHHGLDSQTGAQSLVPGPSMPQPVQNELAGQDSMDVLVRGLAAWNPGLCGGLVEALPAYQETRNLRVLEEALDRAYFATGLVRLGSSRSKDARFVQELLRAEIDRINLRRLFEPRAPGVEAESVLRELLPRGRLGEETLREIAAAGSPERAAEVVSRTAYGDMADALSVFAQTGKFSALDRQFELKFLERLRRAVQREGIGIASLLRYAWLKYNEVMNLRIIAHGLAARLPKARIEQEVLYV